MGAVPSLPIPLSVPEPQPDALPWCDGAALERDHVGIDRAAALVPRVPAMPRTAGIAHHVGRQALVVRQPGNRRRLVPELVVGIIHRGALPKRPAAGV